jgi:hypothetical protein
MSGDWQEYKRNEQIKTFTNNMVFSDFMSL